MIEKFEEQFAEFEAMTGIKVVNEYVPWIETVERYLTMAAGDDIARCGHGQRAVASHIGGARRLE